MKWFSRRQPFPTSEPIPAPSSTPAPSPTPAQPAQPTPAAAPTQDPLRRSTRPTREPLRLEVGRAGKSYIDKTKIDQQAVAIQKVKKNLWGREGEEASDQFKLVQTVKSDQVFRDKCTTLGVMY